MKTSLVMAVLVIVLTLLYLALAVVGAGGLGVFLARPQFVALAVVTLALAVAGLASQAGIRRGMREDRGNRWVLAVFTVIGLLHGYLPAYTDRIGFWTFGGDGVRWLGLVLFVAGGILRLWPVFVLGRRFSGLVAIQPGHSLVTTGIYSRIRHPSYLGALVFMIGWALVFRSGVGILLTAVMLVPLLARILSEERLLQSQFGAEYDAYRARTWRLVPFVY
ncbi:isoprenylcysteine carboxylmethyltransferase family protein [Bradyrhizobium sp. ARR65]|uniref:methyltransferase family protein n=1 Tax=Bradyrhizobium sp. ARR65 TaxID=1040989 RepID=UPI000464AA48|nr:isoprenylcysteine carboxylmethyltransferase family protein [Bradyrhizobium sp. ARR65]